MRVNGNEAWLEQKDWKDFSEYEQGPNASIANQPMMLLCTYPLAASGAAAGARGQARSRRVHRPPAVREGAFVRLAAGATAAEREGHVGGGGLLPAATRRGAGRGARSLFRRPFGGTGRRGHGLGAYRCLAGHVPRPAWLGIPSLSSPKVHYLTE